MSAPALHSPDLSKLLEDGSHFARQNRSTLEIINTYNGKLVAILAIDANPSTTTNEKVVLPNGETAWKDTNLPEEFLLAASRGVVPYSPWIIDVIAEKIANGAKITELCKLSGMPSYAVLCNWRNKYPDVEEKLERAKLDRAEYHRDKAISSAEEADEDNIGTFNLKHNAHKWAAGLDNPKYSPKAKVEATLNVPTQIVVNTGINRQPIQDSPVQGSAREVDEVGEDQGTVGGDG